VAAGDFKRTQFILHFTPLPVKIEKLGNIDTVTAYVFQTSYNAAFILE
jgi:hypothetical protein